MQILSISSPASEPHLAELSIPLQIQISTPHTERVFRATLLPIPTEKVGPSVQLTICIVCVTKSLEQRHLDVEEDDLKALLVDRFGGGGVNPSGQPDRLFTVFLRLLLKTRIVNFLTRFSIYNRHSRFPNLHIFNLLRINVICRGF